jgi:hypothetical protein
MPARIFYLGAPSRVQLPPEASVVEAIQETGGNTGNLLIGHAIKRHLRAESIVTRGTLLGWDYVAKNFDRVVVGASNFLYRDFDFGRWADFLEATQLPCTVFGLGAQAPDYDRSVEVPAGTRRLLKLISERSTTLGVRGHWTASILADLGITNLRVIGCPAIYWTCKPSLHMKPAAKRRPLSVAVNGAANGVVHASDAHAAKAIEAKLARLSFQHGYPYFLQNEADLAAIVADLPSAFESYRIELLMDQYGLSDIGPRRFIEFVKKHTRIHFKVREWHAAMQQFDFVVGTRFHGCLIALLAGVACFVYAHDARTRELCELLRLPYLRVTEARTVDIESLYQRVDFRALEQTYGELYENYVRFLEENGFEHNLTESSREINGKAAVASRDLMPDNPNHAGVPSVESLPGAATFTEAPPRF